MRDPPAGRAQLRDASATQGPQILALCHISPGKKGGPSLNVDCARGQMQVRFKIYFCRNNECASAQATSQFPLDLLKLCIFSMTLFRLFFSLTKHETL